MQRILSTIVGLSILLGGVVSPSIVQAAPTQAQVDRQAYENFKKFWGMKRADAPPSKQSVLELARLYCAFRREGNSQESWYYIILSANQYAKDHGYDVQFVNDMYFLSGIVGADSYCREFLDRD